MRLLALGEGQTAQWANSHCCHFCSEQGAVKLKNGKTGYLELFVYVVALRKKPLLMRLVYHLVQHVI